MQIFTSNLPVLAMTGVIGYCPACAAAGRKPSEVRK
jgi:hypothetical protein